MNLYVGNLPYRVTEDQLSQAFEQYGVVASCTIIKDKFTGQSKGFGFLEMSNGAEAAIAAWNGKDFMGKKLIVNEARPREGGGARSASGTDRGRYNARW
ncbi:MAG: RNA-binding protein [Blastocatellia bacterium]|nr:RNA-binding protein [Blastocatellia bacterium]